MRLLIIDPNGYALDISQRAIQHGHEVKHFIKYDDKQNYIGKGLVDVVEHFEPYLHWADLIFMSDNSKYLRDMDTFRAFGKPIIGPSHNTAQWELDRELGMEILRKHEIAVPKSMPFNNYDKAVEYVKKTNKRYVSKPSGDVDKALSYCSSGPADMCYMLERWKKISGRRDFILQEFISGIEMAVGGWFGPSGFVNSWCENWEFKKLMNGDKGVATGEQGTVLRYVRRSKLAKMVLEPLTETLEKENYLGYIDINCIIDAAGHPWPLEFTMRPGWPTFNIQQELHGSDPVQWLSELALGKDPTILDNTIAIGVVLSIPDYPYSRTTKKEIMGIPIYGITPKMIPHVHFTEVMLGEAPVDRGGKVVREKMVVSAGDYILIMTATGQTVYEAKQTVYRRLDRLQMPNSPMWRTDIGDRLSKQLPILHKQGFATGMEFSTNQPR